MFYASIDVGKLIKNSEIYDLGADFFPGMPHFPYHPPFLFSLAKKHGDLIYQGGRTSASCVFTTGGHTGTHIDAIGHHALDGKIYGDIEISSHQDYREGLHRGGIEMTPPIIQRGLLLDIPKFKGVQILPEKYAVTDNDLKEAENLQGVEVKKNDVLLVRTGWFKHWPSPSEYPKNSAPGIGRSAASWMAHKQISLTGSDTIAYECLSTECMDPGVHTILLVNNGIQIMEVLNLEELSEKSVYEFLFIALPLKILGGTGSPIRPVAIR